ncbi:MAG: P1 family peptidase, partial [Candidatus Korobacteraceae bacterium]
MPTPVPCVRTDGPQIEFDFSGLLIGVAEYEEGPTGLTVFYFPQGVMAAVDVRGGAAATINTDRLRLGYDQPTVRAVFFTGGSSYGLEAASGIMAELLAIRGRATLTPAGATTATGGAVAWEMIPTVTGAVVFDFRGRDNAIHPDKPLGRAAIQGARAGHFPVGERGAGRMVNVGKFFGPAFMESAGQGGAFRQAGATKVAVFTVVNSVGVIVDRAGRVVRGNFDPESGLRSTLAQDLADGSAARKKLARVYPESTPPSPGGGNTTLTMLVTNQQLTHPQLSRMALQTHTSMARAIQPFHTEKDGDVLFAATTGEVRNPDLEFEELAAHAA